MTIQRTKPIIARAMLAALAAGSLLAGATGAAASEDRHVRIINETDHTMVHFYASNVAAKSWEEDILGDSVLKPGDDVKINIDDGTGHCLYDFRAVFDDGKALEKHNINVCEISSYRYTE
ncbi:hypothetical protein ACO2Q3_19715 [Caulobacter sp. KR2-114]|uniref:hypothetical protein n=1 Tax=Caulobacter sp. KR2-114 TaxID=3400912 RepID=UPI003BFDDBD5